MCTPISVQAWPWVLACVMSDAWLPGRPLQASCMAGAKCVRYCWGCYHESKNGRVLGINQHRIAERANSKAPVGRGGPAGTAPAGGLQLAQARNGKGPPSRSTAGCPARSAYNKSRPMKHRVARVLTTSQVPVRNGGCVLELSVPWVSEDHRQPPFCMLDLRWELTTGARSITLRPGGGPASA